MVTEIAVDAILT